MAAFATTNQYLVFNAVDLSDHLKSCTITADGEALDTTAMSSTPWRTSIIGLKSGTVALEFIDDQAAGSVDATVWGAFNTGTAIALAFRQVNTTIATTNPEYQFNVLPNAFNVGGSVGQLAGKTISFPITGSITRDVTP